MKTHPHRQSLFAVGTALRSVLKTGLVALAISLTAGVAHAEATKVDPDIERSTAAHGETLKWNWQPPGKNDRYGHAEVLINAPLAAVRSQVLNFAQYREFAPWRFKQSRIVGREGTSTDVYLQFSVLHGMVNLWTVERFAAPKVVAPKTEVIEGTHVRGNVKDSNVVWTLRTVDDQWTVLKCDILLRPDIPAPQAALDEELRDAAQQAVDKVHHKAQGNERRLAWQPTNKPAQ